MLAQRDGQTFQELADRIHDAEPNSPNGSIHSALGRMRESKLVRFVGHRGAMTYKLAKGALEPQRGPERESDDDPILQMLADAPRLAIGAMATKLFNANNERTQAAVRSRLQKLKRKGLVRNVAHGAWEVSE